MSLAEQIEIDLTEALKTGQTEKKDLLRLLKSEFKNQEITLGRPLEEQEILNIIQKSVKKRQEAAEIYRQAQRPNNAEQEEREINLLNKYLPTQLEQTKLREIIKKYLVENQTTGQELGQAIGQLNNELQGQAQGSEIARIVKEELASQSG